MSGWIKSKIWPVMSIDWLLFQPLLLQGQYEQSDFMIHWKHLSPVKLYGKRLLTYPGIKLSNSGLRITNRFLYVPNQKQHFFNFFTNHK